MSSEESAKATESVQKKHSLEQRLANYKSMQAGIAKNKGVSLELAAARTLTEARKAVYGYKKKNKRKTK